MHATTTFEAGAEPDYEKLMPSLEFGMGFLFLAVFGIVLFGIGFGWWMVAGLTAAAVGLLTNIFIIPQRFLRLREAQVGLVLAGLMLLTIGWLCGLGWATAMLVTWLGGLI